MRHFPVRHRVFVEPFGGAASLLMHKPRSAAEVLNDTDQEVVNLFRIMRDPIRLLRLVELVRWTPLARDEVIEAMEEADDPIEQARRLLLRSWAALRATPANRWGAFDDGRRARQARRLPLPNAWSGMPDALHAIADRLSGVIIENRDPCQVILDYDSAHTLFYVAPQIYARPCCTGRSKAGSIETIDLALSKTLKQVQGYVVLRGEDSASARELYAGWRRVQSQDRLRASGDAEVLWLSPSVCASDARATATEERPS